MMSQQSHVKKDSSLRNAYIATHIALYSSNKTFKSNRKYYCEAKAYPSFKCITMHAPTLLYN